MSKTAVLAQLRKTDFPQNTGRKNNLHAGQNYSLSMVLGQTMKMFCSKEKDPQGCRRPSRHNKKYPELLNLSKALLKSHAPRYAFHSVTINKNHASAKHVDRNNKGFSYIIGLGKYTGGQLVFDSGPYKGVHNIKNKWLKFKGDHPHWVKPFKGERYTLVFYHWA